MRIRTEQELDHARKVVAENLVKPGLGREQVALLSGLSVALQWACNEGGDTLQELLDGRRIFVSSEVN